MIADEEVGFLEEIQGNPDDDTPRLIYADWLEERSDPRAEFIRMQCAASRPATQADPANDTDSRIRTLLEERRKACLTELGPLGIKDIRFARGLVEKIHCVGTAILGHPRLLFRHAPALRGMILRNPPRHGAGVLQGILNSRHLRCLTTLDLSQNEIRSIGSETLPDGPRTAQLSILNLSQNQLSGRGIHELVANPYLAGVAVLNLSRNVLLMHDARLLGRSPHLSEVKSLSLDDNQIEDDGLGFLASSPHLTGLSSLSLQHCEITLAGIRALADSPRLTRLTSLNLSDNPLGDAATAVLASSSNMSQLTTLNLGRCGIGPEGAKALAASLYLKKLTTLDLTGNNLKRAEILIERFGAERVRL